MTAEHVRETIQEMRNLALRGLVLAVNDQGAMMTADVQTHDGLTRSAIEVYQFAGFACAPLVPGATVLLFAMGADPGDLVAIGPIVPAARFGGLLPGEAVVYSLSDGSRIAFRQGGACELKSAASILLQTQTVTINASGGATVTANVSVTGNATIDGNLSVTGNISDSLGSMASMRGEYNAHDHPDAQGGNTGLPTPQMA